MFTQCLVGKSSSVVEKQVDVPPSERENKNSFSVWEGRLLPEGSLWRRDSWRFIRSQVSRDP